MNNSSGNVNDTNSGLTNLNEDKKTKIKKESFVLRTLKVILYFIEEITQDCVGVYSAQASFFMILSIFPIIMLLLNILSLTTLPDSLIPTIIKNYTPSTVRSLLLQIVTELSRTSSSAVISISAILAMWSASKGALSIIFGVRQILDSPKKTNYFLLRFYSMLYTILYILAIVFVLLILVFGNKLFNHLVNSYDVLESLTSLYTFGRYLFAMLFLTLFFISIYRTSGNSNYKFMDHLPGAMFSSLGWMIFSYLFSIYVDNFSNFSYMYGSLTAIIIIMLWLYFCIYIMFIGAEINEYLIEHK